jgi:mannose-1-phosphate guanylyltransferase/mannose-6-phosphate isomerase
MIIPVILSGGSGTRLWPSSSSRRPKQFLPLISEYTLLQETVLRVGNLSVECSGPVIVCNEAHKADIQQQLTGVGHKPEILICEPEGRNTAPAVAAAAFLIARHYSDKSPCLLVLPADQTIKDSHKFSEAVTDAINAAKTGSLVTLGICPDRPETGYGYIKRGALQGKHYAVDEFVEKPDADRAIAYLESGKYYWNSGIFLFSAETYLTELEKYSPEIYKKMHQAYDKAEVFSNGIHLQEENFLSCPSDSIDYAVMEHTDKAVVVPLDAGWSDVGSWASLHEVSDHDECGNSLLGDVCVLDCQDSYLRADTRPLAGIGLKDLIVVDSADGLLVAARPQAQDVSKVSAHFGAAKELENPLMRMWEISPNHQLLSLTVKAGDSISLKDYHIALRSSNLLVVIEGEAQLKIGKKTQEVAIGETLAITPETVIEAILNPCASDLTMLFVVKDQGSHKERGIG